MIEVNKKVQLIVLNEKIGCLLKSTPGSSAYDLRINSELPIQIYPNDTINCGTGIKLNMTESGYSAIVIPRSGLGTKKGVVLSNLVGLIDNDYQGEIEISLWNRRHDKIAYLEPYEKMAQLLFFRAESPFLEMVSEFSLKTERGENGFGSTGRF